MKRILVVLFLLLAFAPVTMSAEFWGSKNSNKYHNPSCQWVQNISLYNRVKFNSPEAAQKAGYVPCKVCKPHGTVKS